MKFYTSIALLGAATAITLTQPNQEGMEKPEGPGNWVHGLLEKMDGEDIAEAKEFLGECGFETFVDGMIETVEDYMDENDDIDMDDLKHFEEMYGHEDMLEEILGEMGVEDMEDAYDWVMDEWYGDEEGDDMLAQQGERGPKEFVGDLLMDAGIDTDEMKKEMGDGEWDDLVKDMEGVVMGHMEMYGLEMIDLEEYAEEYDAEEILGFIGEEMGYDEYDMEAFFGDHKRGPHDFVEELLEEMDEDEIDDAIEYLGEDGFDMLVDAMGDTVEFYMDVYGLEMEDLDDYADECDDAEEMLGCIWEEMGIEDLEDAAEWVEENADY